MGVASLPGLYEGAGVERDDALVSVVVRAGFADLSELVDASPVVVRHHEKHHRAELWNGSALDGERQPLRELLQTWRGEHLHAL